MNKVENRKIWTVGVVFLNVMLVACGPQQNMGANDKISKNIIGGAKASMAMQLQVGTVAVIVVKKDLFSGRLFPEVCSGSLIKENIVLTAAHCIFANNISYSFVVFDTDIRGFTSTKSKAYEKLDFLRSNKKVRMVESSKRHEDYAKPVFEDQLDPKNMIGMNDLAVLKLAQVAPAGFTAARIADLPLNPNLIFLGFGVTNAISKVSVYNQDIKSETTKNLPLEGLGTLRIISDIPLLDQTDKELMVDQYQGAKGTCYGDSGGPVFSKSTSSMDLVAITSRGTDPKGNCIDRAILTRLSPYLNWIQSAIDKLNSAVK